MQTALRRRFHDETGTGEPGTPAGGVKARVSYGGAWYDRAAGAAPTIPGRGGRRRLAAGRRMT